MPHYTWNWASVYWLLWLVLGFLPLEIWALVTRQPQYTLSDQVWHLEGSGMTAARFAVFAILLWLLIHMVWAKFT
jgi:hypothetical protein